MKYRRNKVKREHGIIRDALNWLEELSQCTEVTDIIPGLIEVSRSPEKGIVYKYQTQTGCKLLLKSNGSIQEAFVVTKNPDVVKQWIEHRFPEQKGHRQENKSATKYEKKNTQTKKSFHHTSTPNISWQKGEMTSGNFNPANLGQLLNSNTRQALRNLQKDLSQKTKNDKQNNKQKG